MYLSLYNNLCNSRKSEIINYTKGSGLHEHHILPKHSGGSDDQNNFTYLTVREHIIAHFLLWKIYRNPNDIRAMKMLGAKLTPAQRKETGIYCRDNKIGIYGASKEEKFKWRKMGIKSQYDAQIGIHDPIAKKKYASMGGKVGGKHQKEMKIGIHDPVIQKQAASLGGKIHKGKWWIYYPPLDRMTRILPEMYPLYHDQGWLFGRRKKSLMVSS